MRFFNDQSESEPAIGSPLMEAAPGPVPLSCIRSGQTARVECLPICDRAAARLCALGLTPGTEFKVISNLFGPVLLEVRGSRLSLGHGLAVRLLVSPGRNGGAGRRRQQRG